VLLPSHVTSLPQDSVANASLVIAIDKGLLIEHVGKLTRAKLELVLAGFDAVLGK
jgi:mRNA-degrading endonuclease toxin of MazEF toxin-antitoxin module